MNENVYLHAFLLLVICAFGMQTKGRMYIYSFSLVFLINSFGLPLSAVAFFGWTAKKTGKRHIVERTRWPAIFAQKEYQQT